MGPKSYSSFLSLILLGICAVAAVLPRGLSQPPFPVSPLKFQETFEKKSDKIRLKWSVLLPPTSKFACNDTLDQSMVGQKKFENEIFGVIFEPKAGPGDYMLVLIPEKDPQALQRMAQGFQTLQTFNRKFTPPVLDIQVQQDFLQVVIEGHVLTFFEMFKSLVGDFHFGNFKSESFLKVPKFFEYIRDFHKTGYIGINPMVLINQRAGTWSFTMYGLHWMVKAGEEVGSNPFHPVLTDPLALADPTFKADEALDYYSLGTQILRNTLNYLDKEVPAGKTDQEIIEMKKKGEFHFPAKMDVGLAFLAACFLQNDRKARLSLHCQEALLDYIGSAKESIQLTDPLVYSPTTDPWTMPEFQSMTERVRAHQTDSHSSQPDTSKTHESADGELSGLPEWVYPVGIGAAALLLVLGLFLFCRKSPEAGADEAEAKKGLHHGEAEEPTIVERDQGN